MPETHFVYLIPGFFGFANLGEIVYFSHTRELLGQIFSDRRVPVEIIQVHTSPTASIRRRAQKLAEVIRDTAGDTRSPIHLIGHSTGGLDARLLVSPGTQLADGLDLAPIVERVRTVVTVSTPHYGTPLASFFTTLFGAQLLKLLSLFTVYVLRYGRVPLKVLIPLGRAFARMDNRLGIGDNVIDQLFRNLLDDLSPERATALTEFFQEVGADQALIPQLTPEGMDLFNASTGDRPGIRYGSVVTMAPPPSLKMRLSLGLDPYVQVTHTIYQWLHAQNSRMPPQVARVPTPAQLKALARTFSKLPGPKSSDGIVPTLSQPWGEVIRGVQADHLDVVGHFDDPKHLPPHIDWLITGSGFRRPSFELLWNEVVDFIAPATGHAFSRRGS